MENNQINERDTLTIDLKQIGKAVLKKIWLILLVAVIGGALALTYAVYFIEPQYESSVMLYVNSKFNTSTNPSTGVTTGELSAAQSLVKTYREILLTRDTLEGVIADADLSYTYKELAAMIDAESANNTEIMRVIVTAKDPEEAAEIANSITHVLPGRINQIIEGATMKVAESAIPHYEKVSPSYTKYTAIGFLLSAFLVGAIVVIMSIMDDTIHDEEYLIQTYDYPILAKIPDLTAGRTKGYGGYYKEKKPAEESKTKKEG